jgi:hypothetical protein
MGYYDRVTGKWIENSDVYSMTEEPEKWANQQGMSFNSNNANYFGKVYNDIFNSGVDSLVNQRNQGITDMREVYGNATEQSKYKYNQNVITNADVYRDNAVQANSRYQNMANVYGSNQDKLAQMGLTGSGYNAYLQGNAYSDYQNDLSNAYNQKAAGVQNAQSILNSEVYGYNQEMAKGISGINQDYADAYRGLQTKRDTDIATQQQALLGKYQEEKAIRDSETSTIKFDATSGVFSKSQLDGYKASGKVTDAEYNEIYGIWNKRKEKELTDKFNGIDEENYTSTTYLSDIDNAFTNGDINEEQRGAFYAKTYPDDINRIKDKKDYYKVLAQLETEKGILGSQYSVVLNQLNNSPKVKEILAKESEKAANKAANKQKWNEYGNEVAKNFKGFGY